MAGVSEERLQRWVARWRACASDGDAQRFARRLSLDGLTLRSATALLAGHPRRRRDLQWLAPVRAALRAERASVRAPQPFECDEVMAPLVASAQRRLRRRLGATRGLLLTAAEADLARALSARLERVARATFEFEAAVGRSLSFVPVDGNRMPPLRALVRAYPVLARALGTVTAQWETSVSEMLARYVRDWPALRSLAGPGSPRHPARIERVDCDLSDPHDGGRVVHVIRPETGAPVVYKPRSLAPEAAYQALIAWLNRRSADSGVRELRQVAVLNRGSHGWMEFVRSRPCRTAHGRRRMRERCGVHLALAVVLGAVDLHQDNIILDGEHPVLVDLESMLHPRATCADARRQLAHLRARQSRPIIAVMCCPLRRTGLLPGSYRDADGRDASGFAHGLATASTMQDVIRAFARTMRLLGRERARLTQRRGPLGRIEELPTRVILRPTHTYRGLLAASLAPAFLADGRDRSLELDALARAVVPNASAPAALWPAVAEERRALAAMDIPAFRRRRGARAGQRRGGTFKLPVSARDELAAGFALTGTRRLPSLTRSLRRLLRPASGRSAHGADR